MEKKYYPFLWILKYYLYICNVINQNKGFYSFDFLAQMDRAIAS